jgi:hypothetical protein
MKIVLKKKLSIFRKLGQVNFFFETNFENFLKFIIFAILFKCE